MQIFVPEISHCLLQYILFYLQIFMSVCVCTTVDRWESEDTLQDLLFSSTMHGTGIKLKLSSLAAGKHSYLASTLFFKEASYYVFHTILELPAVLLQPMRCLDYWHIAAHSASLQYFNRRILRVFRHFWSLKKVCYFINGPHGGLNEIGPHGLIHLSGWSHFES